MTIDFFRVLTLFVNKKLLKRSRKKEREREREKESEKERSLP